MHQGHQGSGGIVRRCLGVRGRGCLPPLFWGPFDSVAGMAMDRRGGVELLDGLGQQDHGYPVGTVWGSQLSGCSIQPDMGDGSRGGGDMAATQNGDPASPTSLFLSQAISHLDQYAQLYPSQWAMVVAITAVLEDEAAEWVADLHNEHTRELANVGLFLKALRVWFEDGSRAQWAEGYLLALKQRGRPAVCGSSAGWLASCGPGQRGCWFTSSG